MNPKRIKDIEKLLNDNFIPQIYKYYKLSNGKYLLIEPNKAGFKTVIELIYEGEEYLTGRLYDNIEEIKQEYPGVIDAKNEIELLSSNVKILFV